ncbi:MAG: sortase [Candidatus Shapirobacteria bacterium]|jgi:LPXTG-site transpeptidase (sortase) family protein
MTKTLKLFIVSSVLLFTAFFSLGSKTINLVRADDDGSWGPWVDTSSCVPNASCGTTTGTKSQQRTCVDGDGECECKLAHRECDKGCPTVTNWTAHKCSPEYKYESEDGKCHKKNHDPQSPLETFTIPSFNYIKSEDPNKCHRPTGSSLAVPSWAEDDFNKDNPEHRDEVDINCHDVPAESQTQNVTCSVRLVACDVDCVFHWGSCSKSCGGGTQEVIIDTPSSGNGKECPSEPQSCNTFNCEQACPEDCGYEGGTVDDGNGGQKECPATNSCSTKRWCFEDEESSTGYIARAIPLNENPTEGKPWESGKMINKYCAYAAEEQCPTQCGQQASEVNDGKGGKKQCAATKECEISGTPSPTPTVTPTVTPVPTATPTESPVGGGDNGGSNPGAPVCNDAKPGTPSNLRVTRISSTQVRLDWDHASDPHTSYVVAYGPSIGNYPWGSPNVGNSNSYTVNSLTPGAQYCFYVRAQNNCMPGDKSNEVCINVGSTVKILGVTDNYNPLVDGIRESYGGDILGATTELMATAEVVYSQNKLPSGNTLASGQSISIPRLGVNQPIYNPARIGDDYTVGHQEVLHTTIDGSSVYYGHNGYDVFGGLYKTNIGDQVVTNNNGVDAGYQVTEKLFVHKSQVDSIKTSGDQIVLVTCSFTQPDYRIVIKASLTK